MYLNTKGLFNTTKSTEVIKSTNINKDIRSKVLRLY